MRTTRFSSCRLAALFVPTAIALAACGGSDDPPAAPDGGGGGGGGGGAVTLSIDGTAAVGAAIAGGTVDAQCAVGDNTATTAADGSYLLQIENGRLPCTLRVVSADGATVLHSAATGSGNSAHANLTPATELAMAQLYGRNPAAAHFGFDAAAVVALTPAALQAAASATTTLLAAAGVTISGNPISGPLVIGDANDQALAQLKATLESSGTTLNEVANAVIVGKGGTPVGTVSPLPIDQLLAASAANCKALRSGRYRVILAGPAEAGEVNTDILTLDASTLRFTGSNGEVDALVANGPCRFITPNGELVVSPAGVGVFRSEESPSGFALGMVFPEQIHPVSATAGEWNYMGLANTDGSFGTPHLFTGTMTVNGSGKVTADNFCDNVRNCVGEIPESSMVFTANAAGGFNFDGSRAFAYRAGGGETMIAVTDADGGFALATRKVARTLPEVGSSSVSWNLTLTPQFSAQAALSDSESTVRSVDAASGSYLRDAIIDFNTGVTRPERIEANRFLDGFFHRIPETVAASNGSASTVGEWVALGLRGMGVTPVAILSNNNLVLSVTKPPPAP